MKRIFLRFGFEKTLFSAAVKFAESKEVHNGAPFVFAR